MGYTEDIFSALDVQDELQTLYTSGTVFHAFLGEKLPDWKAAAALVRKIAENYRLPYYTMSPTYSVCAEHGYLAGEQFNCPHCGKRTEVYSRITGYYRPVQNWNDGKSQEFRDRLVYDVAHSHLRHNGVRAEEETVEKALCGGTGELLLFATKTCPNCRQAEKLLKDAGITYRKVLADENQEMAVRYGIRQAPTLVVDTEDQPAHIVGVGPIRKYIQDQTVRQ